MAPPLPRPAAERPALAPWLYPANLVTELRLLAIPVLLAAVALRHDGWALVLFTAAAVSDGFDGWLARHFNQRSVLGAYLDPVSDKLLLTTLFVVLAVQGRLPWALALLVLVRDFCILFSALALYLFTTFRDFRPTMWGKASTTAELSTVTVALMSDVWPKPWIFALEHFGWAAVTFCATVSGIHYAFTAARRYHDEAAHTRHPATQH